MLEFPVRATLLKYFSEYIAVSPEKESPHVSPILIVEGGIFGAETRTPEIEKLLITQGYSMS
jgi:hypothetical protein